MILLACSFVVSCAASPGPVKRKMIGLLQKFDRWDYNGDGFLVPAELDEAERIGGVSKAEVIEFYDRNQDSKISLKEASGGIERVEEAKKLAEQKEAIR